MASASFSCFRYIYFMFMSVLPTPISVHHVHAWYLWSQKRAVDSLELELLMVSCECLELNLGPLEEKVFLTTETFLQPHNILPLSS